MGKNQDFVFVVLYRDTRDTESNAEAWQDQDFEPYDWYDTKEEADKICKELNQELKDAKRTDKKVFVKRTTRKFCEIYLA